MNVSILHYSYNCKNNINEHSSIAYLTHIPNKPCTFPLSLSLSLSHGTGPTGCVIAVIRSRC